MSRRSRVICLAGKWKLLDGNALLKKNENCKISVKDIEFFVVSHHGHLSGFSEAPYAAMCKKAILNIVSIHHNDQNIMRAIRRKLMPQGLMTVSRFRCRDLAADDRQPGVAVPNEPAATAAAEHGRRPLGEYPSRPPATG
jgi:hypothetical protein